MTERIEPIVPRLRWDVLTADDIERIHEAILRTLADVGVRFPSDKALDVLERSGCRVDWSTQVVRMPHAVVLEALAAAPRGFTLAGRDPTCDLTIDLRRSHLSNDGSGVWLLDPLTGEKRPSAKADVAESARVIDALPSISYCWGPIVTSQDVPAATRGLHDAEAVFANTSKHFQTVTTVGAAPARAIIEMAAAVAGGTLELRRRPLLSMIQCPVDPLGNDAMALEAGLVAAEHGVPCGFLSLTLGGGTAPATPAGNLVVNLAAVLADLVLLQLAHPGAPVFMGSAPSIMDLKTGGYTGGGPEDHLLAIAGTQMAHFYGLPVAMGTMATGAKEPGWQAGVDDSLSTIASVMSWADMMNGAGLLAGSTILSYPHLVMESEIHGIVTRMARGIEVSDETLALDVIGAVGQGGTYLSEKHTRRHMTEIWRPGIWDRSPYDVWLRDGRAGALEKATEVAGRILETHVPQPLPADVAAELRAIVARADAEILR